MMYGHNADFVTDSFFTVGNIGDIFFEKQSIFVDGTAVKIISTAEEKFDTFRIFEIRRP